MSIPLEPKQPVARSAKAHQQTAGKAFPFVRWYWLLFFLLLLGLSALLVFNAYPASTGTTRSPILEADQFPSKGIGLTKAEWEKSHVLKVDKSSTPTIYDPHVYDYGGKPSREFIVGFWPDPQRNNDSLIIYAISGSTTKILSDIVDINVPVESLDQEKMQQAARALMPDDAELMESGILPTHRHEIIETYHSKLLEERYPSLLGAPKPWGDSPPGNIHVTYDGIRRINVSALLAAPDAPAIPEPPSPTLVDTPLPLPTPLPTEIRPLIPTPFGTKPVLPVAVPSHSLPTP